MNQVQHLYRISGLPLFQNKVYASEQEAIACLVGEMDLVENLESGLVYNDAFRPDLMNYDADYNNEQAVSPSFQDHLRVVAETIERYLGRKDIIEVGCGKGRFLEMLLENGFDVTGFDPTYQGDNPRIKKEYFLPTSHIRGRGLILRHVLEHIQNPSGFLSQLRDANDGGGLVYIEVPCFDWICDRAAWFDVFYEHVNYFRLSDFRRMFGDVIHARHLFGRQYIGVVADLATLREPRRDASDPVRLPAGFEPKIHMASGTQSAIWGGGSKGVIFSLMMQRAGLRPELVIDINPAKQGRHLPVTGLRISPPEALSSLSDGAVIYVMNGNYLDEIRAMSQDRFTYIAVDAALGSVDASFLETADHGTDRDGGA